MYILTVIIIYSTYIQMTLKLGRDYITVLPYKEIPLQPHLTLLGCYKFRYGLPRLNFNDT